MAVLIFSVIKETSLMEHFKKVLAYLADIYKRMKETIFKILGPEVTIVVIDIHANLKTLEEVFCQDAVKIQNYISVSLKTEICEHLRTLQGSFKSFFSLDGTKVEPWILSPFLPI
jgi:hypothetical protein